VSKITFQIKLVFLCLALLVLPLSFACSSVTSGTTVFSSIQGEVLVKKSGTNDWINGVVKMALDKGDVIKSGAEADAIVTFFDGSTIELKADTQIEITELLKSQAKAIRLKQEIGETISKVEKLIDPASRYEVETPAAVAGVRGSSMLVHVIRDGTTTVQNLEGQISVTAQGVELIIPEGGAGTVQPGEPPILVLKYDDGRSEGGYSLGGPLNYGYMVRFESDTPFEVTKIRILSWIKGTPVESDQFTLRITDKDLAPLWEITLPYATFTTEPSWLVLEVPGVTIDGEFCVQLNAPTLGQGLGPYIGIDKGSLNAHSEIISGWELVEWTISVPKEQTNWMIRVNGNAITGP
jgi:hypothetical protein